MKPHPGEHAHDQHGNQGNSQIHHGRHDPGQRVDVLGHIDLGNQAGIAHDGSQSHAAGLGEKVEHHSADNQVSGKVGHITFEDGGKHKILHQHGEQRV